MLISRDITIRTPRSRIVHPSSTRASQRVRCGDYAARNVRVYKELYRRAIDEDKLAPQWREVLG